MAHTCQRACAHPRILYAIRLEALPRRGANEAPAPPAPSPSQIFVRVSHSAFYLPFLLCCRLFYSCFRLQYLIMLPTTFFDLSGCSTISSSPIFFFFSLSLSPLFPPPSPLPPSASPPSLPLSSPLFSSLSSWTKRRTMQHRSGPPFYFSLLSLCS